MAEFQRRLESSLREMLRGCTFDISPVAIEFRPILTTLYVGSYRVVFADTGGCRSNELNDALEKFRALYSENADQWSNDDLALVACATTISNGPSDELYRWLIDPYFCRRAVLDTMKELEPQLDRMPFMPLTMDSKSRPVRSPGASECLLRRGISNELCRSLVLPHVSSAETIVQNALAGRYGQPELSKLIPTSPTMTSSQNRSKVKLQAIEVSNFRAYRKVRKFDLDANYVFIYGPNGIGKTSLFDAIDYACTGGVARFDQRYKKPDRVRKALVHLDAGLDESFVNLTYTVDGKSHNLMRSFGAKSEVAIDAEPGSRKEALKQLVGESDAVEKLRVDVLINLFRASHTFSQEFQLQSPQLFREHSRLESDAISRMLAFQDYVQASDKMQSILWELEANSKEIKESIERLNEKIGDRYSQLEAIKGALDEASPVGDLDSKVVTLVASCARVLNVNLRTKDIEFDAQLKELHLMLASEVASTDRFLTGAERAVKAHQAYAHNLAQRIVLEAAIEDKRRVESSQSETSRNLEVRIKRLRDEQIELLDSRVECRRQIELTKLLTDQLPIVDQQKVARERLTNDINAVDVSIIRQSSIREDLIAQRSVQLNLLRNINRELSSLEQHMTGLADLSEKVSQLANRKAHRLQLLKEMKASEMVLEQDEKRLLELVREVAAAGATYEQATQRLKALRTESTDLQSALDVVERLIRTSICPVCGKDHQTVEQLREKLATQRQSEPAAVKEALSHQIESDRQRKKLVEESQNVTRTITDRRSHIEQLKSEISLVDRLEELVKEQLKSIGLSLSEESLSVSLYERLQRINEQRDAQLSKKSKTAAELDKLILEVNRIEGELEILRSQRFDHSNNLGILEHELTALEKKFAELREGLGRQIDFQTPAADSLDTHRNTLVARDESLSKKLEQIRQELTTCEQDLKRSNQVGTDVASELNGLRSKLAVIRTDIEEYVTLSRDLGFDEIPTTTRLQELVALSMEKRRALANAQEETLRLQAALAAAASLLTRDRLRSELESLEKDSAGLLSKREQLEKWRSYFRELKYDIDKIHSDGVSDFTKFFGPLASNVQCRLRSVFGFGDIKLRNKDKEIEVMVERLESDEYFRPSDYFSESQLQVVMLSLFLSMALGQSWSAFAPVLLDDPVEHFDDLNNYALLDLLKAINSDNNPERQLIVSTCEKRLFNIMRQRFGHSECNAIFYEFKSIGSEGPTYVKL